MSETIKPFSEPAFNIDTTNDTVRLRLDALEQDIKRDPYPYKSLLTQLGQTATSEIQVDETVNGDAIARLREFFAEGDDRAITFDAETEATLATNEEYQLQLALLRQHPARTRRIGKGGFEQVPDPEAGVIRDRARMLLLGHFINRVISWQENQDSDADTPDELRSVG